MKSLNVRKSLGVATVLSLSLLGSLSSAAIASADETPDPSASVITSTSPEPDSSTSASQSAADETPAPSSSPSASADDENAEIPEGSVDVVFSINGEKIKPGNFAKVDQSNRTLRVDYNLIVPEGVEKFANSFLKATSSGQSFQPVQIPPTRMSKTGIFMTSIGKAAKVHSKLTSLS